MSSAYANAVGFWVALICALAVAKDGHIHTAHHRYVAVERTDSLGAQLHTRATCMMEAALSRDVTYIHNPFPEHISHSVDGIAAERWFNLGEGYTPLATALSSVTVTSAKGCVCFSDLNSQAWPLLSTALLAKYNSPLATPKPRRYPLYRNDAVNVAVHLRRGDVEDCSEESRDGMKQHAETESAGVIDLLVDPCRVPRERCVSINHTVNTVTDVVAMISSMSLMRVNVVVFTEAVDGQHKHFVRDEFRRALPAQDISVVIGGTFLRVSTPWC